MRDQSAQVSGVACIKEASVPLPLEDPPGESGNLPGTFEYIAVEDAPAGEYKATVVRYATARDDYTLTVRRFNVVPGEREPWLLTCETPSGTVLQRAQVVVDRGQTAKADLKLCSKSG